MHHLRAPEHVVDGHRRLVEEAATSSQVRDPEKMRLSAAKPSL